GDAWPQRSPRGPQRLPAARPALPGAGLAVGGEPFSAAALAARFHEPYRSPFLAEVRASLPDGALGATLSGSGPTVIVWARAESADACTEALTRAYRAVRVVRLTVSPRGAVP